MPGQGAASAGANRSQVSVVGHRSGHQEGCATERQRDEQAGPFIGIVQAYGDAWRMKNDNPQQKHEAQTHGREPSEAVDGDGHARGDEGYASEIDPEQMSWNPGRHQGGEKWCELEMLIAEDDHRHGKDVATGMSD